MKTACTDVATYPDECNTSRVETGNETKTQGDATMTTATINNKCCEIYGCGIACLSSTAALWLAETLTRETGVNMWKKVAAIRNRHGLGTAYPELGTICF